MVVGLDRGRSTGMGWKEGGVVKSLVHALYVINYPSTSLIERPGSTPVVCFVELVALRGHVQVSTRVSGQGSAFW